MGLAVDATGAVYVTGVSSSADFPTTPGAYQRTNKGPTALAITKTVLLGDAFVTKFKPDGTAQIYSTLIGGNDDDIGWAIAVDAAGNAYVAGFTNSTNFPVTADALQRTFGGAGGQDQPIGDGFLLKLSADGATLGYSTYFGGKQDDSFAGMATDAAGGIYLTGSTESPNFPVTPGAAQRSFGGMTFSGRPLGDAMVVKISGLFPPAFDPIGTCAAPPISITSVANAASNAKDTFAAGEIVTISGSGIGPQTLVNAAPDPVTGRYGSLLAGARVLFDGVPATMLYASDTQSRAIVPYSVAGASSTKVQAVYNCVQSAPLTLIVAAASPGLFSAANSGSGQGAILNEDGSPNSADNPASAGALITLSGTGEGQTSPPGVDGQVATDTLPVPILPVSVTIGGIDAPDIQYAGVAPMAVAGMFQVIVRVPDGVASGDQPVVVTVGGFSSQPNLTVAIQ